MKKVSAYVHHIRTAPIIEALSNSGFKNITLLDVKGSLKPLGEPEKDYSSQAGITISESRISLVCEDEQVEGVTEIMRRVGSVGPGISGWVYVSPIEQVLPIVDIESQ